MNKSDPDHRNYFSGQIPKDEIKSYIAYDLVINALQRLKHNSFAPGIGYVAYNDQHKTYSSYWQNKLSNIHAPDLDEFCISPSYLCLDLIHPNDPFEPYDNKWTPIASSFHNYAQQTLDRLQGTRSSRGHVFPLKKLYYFLWREFYATVSQNFRREGLKNYYSSRSNYSLKYAELFAHRIKEIVLGRLYVEHKNQDSLDSILAMLEHIEATYLPAVNALFTKRKKGLKIYTEHCHAKISLFLGKHHNTFWFIHNVQGKHKMEKVLVKLITEFWYSKWELHAIGFALKLIPDLQAQVKKLQSELQGCYNTLSATVDTLKLQKDLSANILARECDSNDQVRIPGAELCGVNRYLIEIKSDKLRYNSLLEALLYALDQNIRQSNFATLMDRLVLAGEVIADRLVDRLVAERFSILPK
ncbi:hypothetical protein EYV94_08135 [Puteibacter caeruleilacunae]|nr:hypothetical protein EYV94_08135 [Puteibacter caeruleilacunae]